MTFVVEGTSVRKSEVRLEINRSLSAVCRPTDDSVTKPFFFLKKKRESGAKEVE